MRGDIVEESKYFCRSTETDVKKTAENTAENTKDIAVSEKPEDRIYEASGTVLSDLEAEIEEMKNKYLRLYAEFENFKKKTQKDKEELIKYSNESLVLELLPVLDSMEMALLHGTDQGSESGPLLKGVENTIREMNRTLGKFGLAEIEAVGKPFDPACHHAMSQVERNDVGNNIVVEEFRKGYLLRDKVLRPSLVIVSKKTSNLVNESMT
jgi:molecular chaperone GrpE